MSELKGQLLKLKLPLKQVHWILELRGNNAVSGHDELI
jgi:hypothetical protein